MMKKKIVVLTMLLFIFLNINAQEIKGLFLTEFLSGNRISSKNLKENFKKEDFSNIIENNSSPGYGYIGKKKQRADMVFLSVIKNTIEDNYLIYGKTFICEKISEFQGFISINKIQQLANYSNRYLVSAKFVFFENKQPLKSLIKGECFLKIIEKKGSFQIDNTDLLEDDKFYNNAYLGEILKSDKGSSQFRWGDFMPPLAGDLDVGDNSFVPNSKYSKNGWKSLIEAYKAKGGILFDKKYNKWWLEK